MDDHRSRCYWAVDDATGSVVNALFCRQEDSHNCFLLMQNLLRHCGIPLALYTDRHAVFKHTPGSGSTGTPTQFGRAMAGTGYPDDIRLVTPGQRTGGTCRGTFQDRLITELRLAGATTIEQAKAVLKQFPPRYNRRSRFPPSARIRLSGPCRRICTWDRSCASNTRGEWPGTTP